MADEIERLTLSELAMMDRQRGLETEKGERLISGNEQLALNELHKVLARQAELDLVVSRMLVTQDSMFVTQDKMDHAIRMLDQRGEVDGEQIERLMAARYEMLADINDLRRQQQEYRERQQGIADILSAYTKRLDAFSNTTHQERAKMSTETPVTPVVVVSPPVARTKQWPHVLTGFFFLGLLVASGMQRFAAYSDVLRAFCGAFGFGTFALCRAYLGERIWSIVESFSPTPVPAAAKPMVNPSVTAGVALVLVASMLSACLPPLSACVIPAPTNVGKCTLEKNLISCGEKTGFDLIPIVLGIVVGVIGSTFDPAVLVASLESEGFADIPCVLAAVESYLLPSDPALAAKIHLALVYKLKKDGMHGVVDVKIKSGMVRAVLGQ